MISVIIPAYNAEQYIEKTLDSVLNQTYRDIEIIVCDDGSSDDTVGIVSFIAERDERVKLLSGPHAGRGAARNRGIRAASGEWIAFVDADDELALHAYETALTKLGDREAGLVIFSIKFVRADIYLWPPKIDALHDAFYPGTGDRADTFMDAYLQAKKMLVYSQCNKLYRRDLINKYDLGFAEDVHYGEDRLFNYSYLRHAGSVLTISDRLYKYNMRRETILPTAISQNRMRSLLHLAEQKIALFKDYGYTDEDLLPIKFHDANSIVEEEIKYLMMADRLLAPTAVRRLIRELFTNRYPAYYFSRKVSGSRRKRLFLIVLKMKSIFLMRFLVRVMRLRDDANVLKRRKTEINHANELSRLNLLSARGPERKKYYYLADYELFLDRINKEEFRYLLRDKGILLRRFASSSDIDFLGREWLDLRRCTFDDFAAFVQRHDRMIAKKFNAHWSQGLELIDAGLINTAENETTQDIYERLIKGQQYIVEEYIIQHEQIMRFYTHAVATLRVFTLNLSGSVETVFMPTINFGHSGAVTNNTASVQAFFEEKSGIVTSDGSIQSSVDSDKPWTIVEFHPDSNVRFKDTVIPFSSEAVAMVNTAARLVPEVPFIGWDVAITQTGPVIVEGNAAPMLLYSWQTMYRDLLGIHGMRKVFDSIAAKYAKHERKLIK